MKIVFVVALALFAIPVLAATSAANRADKKVELTVQAGGDYRSTPVQFAAMYFLDADNLVGLKVGTDSQEEESQTNLALQYKHYTGNSFYVAAELFYLNTREEQNWFINELFNVESEYADYKSLGAGVRIGNQWTWKYFTLGCDWIGVGRRFGTFHKDTDKLQETTFTFLNVIAGISF